MKPPTWLRRRSERRPASEPTVTIYLTNGVAIHGQLVGEYPDALVVGQARLLRDGQTNARPHAGAIRVMTSQVEFYTLS